MKIIKVNAIWCSGCLAMKKVWQKIENGYPNIEIETYDYDMDEDIVSKLNIGEILPVTILQNNGKEIRLIGEKTEKEITEKIDEISK